MQIELPAASWAHAPAIQDDAHTWTLPEVAPIDFAPGAIQTVDGSLRISVPSHQLPEITVTF